MNRIMCELLRVAEHKRQSDGTKYYSITILIENKTTVLFFNNQELFENLNKLERLSDVCLLGELKIKDDHSFIFVPQNFEM